MRLNAASMILGALAISCAVLSGFFTTQEIGEINRRLPDDQQISYWRMYTEKFVRMKREYGRLYPGGRLHTFANGFEVAALAFFLLAVFAARFFR